MDEIFKESVNNMRYLNIHYSMLWQVLERIESLRKVQDIHHEYDNIKNLIS